MKKLKGLNRKNLKGGAIGLSSRRRAIVTGLGAFLCALLVAVSFGLMGGTKGRIADAQASTAGDIRLGELTLSNYDTRHDGKVFNGVVLDKLYDALLGSYNPSATTHKTLANVGTVLTGTKSYGANAVALPMYKDAYDLYDANGGKNIVLNFGGYEWTVTFLTRAGEGSSSDHIIATLWLTDLLRDSTNTDVPVYTSMGWATSTTGAGNGGDQSSTYPGDMYSTSEARVKTLNAGGIVATGASSTTPESPVSQNAAHQLAKFTMDSTTAVGQKSLTDYIVQPNNVKYQHYENWQYQWANVSSNGDTYPLHNEALDKWNGTTGTATAAAPSRNWYPNFNYTGKAIYDDWGNDYVWLPSLSETGRIKYNTIAGAQGLWRTTWKDGSGYHTTGQTTHTANGYPNNSIDGTNPNVNWQNVDNNTNYAWLRSSGGNHASGANYLSGTGGDAGAFPACQLAVRPALHLDLTSAAQAAGLESPSNVSTYKDGNNVTKDLVYDPAKTWQLADFGAEWYDFAAYIGNTSYKYLAPGDTNSFGPSTPGPTGGIHNAGKYEVEFTLRSDSPYKWADPTDPTKTTDKITFIITITQKEIEYEPKLYKGSTAVSSITYGDTGGEVKANVDTNSVDANDTGTAAPDIEIKYAGVSGTTYASSTTFPTNAGSYQATITDKNKDTSNYKLKLKSGASNPLQFSVDKKAIADPTVTPDKDYNAADQDFQLGGSFDHTILKITSIKVNLADGSSTTLTQSGTNYADGTRYKVATALTGAPYKLTVKEAAEYEVAFDFIDNSNYTWANNATKKVTFNVNKKVINLTLNSPAGSWVMPLGSTGNITATSLTGVEGSDVLTFSVSYYENKPSTAPAPTTMQTNVEYGDIELAANTFANTGNYVIWVQLWDDSTGNDVNRNYKFNGTDANTDPVTENVFTQAVTIGTGSVDVSGIKWSWQQTLAGIPTPIDSNTKLVYAQENGIAKDYIVTVTNTSLPAYLQIDDTYQTNGFKDGYSGNCQSDADTYTAQVRLKIADGNTDFKFESTGSHGYTYVSDTVAVVEYTWTIEKQELDLSALVWQYSQNAMSETDPAATWTKFDATHNPENNDKFVYVRIDPESMKALGLKDGEFSIGYTSNSQIVAKTSTTTGARISLTGDGAKNFKLPDVAPGSYNATYTWEIGNKQIHISGWGNKETLNGYSSDGEPRSYQIPRITISNNDGVDYTPYLEYTYDYVIDGTPYTNRTEAQMIQDVFAVASIDHKIEGTVYVSLNAQGSLKYALEGTTDWPFDCGQSKTVVNIGIGGGHEVYGDNGTFTITGTYHAANIATLPEMDFVAESGSKLQITITDKDGQVIVFTADSIGDDVLAFVKNAGAYTVEFEITDAGLDNAYALSKTSLIYKVEKAEITVPQVIKALTFNGDNLTFTEYLDNQYVDYKNIIEVIGDNIGRNVIKEGGYTVSLVLTDDNYGWALPSGAKSGTRASLAADEIETTVSVSDDASRAMYSWNVEPLKIDSSKMWKDGKLNNLPKELTALMNNGLVDISYNYYDTDGFLVGNSAEGFEPEGGKAYRIEAVLTGGDAELGNVVFVKSNGEIAGATSDQTTYTPKKSGMAKFKETLTTKYAGLPLWAWILIGVCALILLIVLICIIVAACKRKKKKEEEKAAKAEKEEAKQAAAAAAAAPMLAMSASMADEKAKLEAEKAKMEAELAKAKMEAEAEAARAKAQAELDLQKAKAEAEIAKMRAEAQAAHQPAPAPQPVQQPVYQQPQPQYIPMPQPQPQYMPMPMPQPQYSMPQQSGGSSSLEHMLMEMKAQQAISEAKNEAQFRIMSAENKAAQEVAEAKAQARNSQQMPQYPNMMGMGMNPMMGMGMGMAMPPMMGYPQPAQPAAQQQGNGNSPVILTIGPNGEVKQVAPQAPAPVVQQPQVQPILINVTQPAQPAAQQLPAPAPAQAQPAHQEPAQQPAQAAQQPLSAQYPPGAVVTTTTTVDTTKSASDVPEIRRRRNEENDLFDIDGFYDKYEGNNNN